MQRYLIAYLGDFSNLTHFMIKRETLKLMTLFLVYYKYSLEVCTKINIFIICVSTLKIMEFGWVLQ